MRWRFWGLLVAAIVVMPVVPARASVPVVVIDGRGFGHGVGMAQDGAFWMAKAGATTPQILGHFYPGTTLRRVNNAAVRVAVFTGAAATIAFPAGGRIDASGAGFPIHVEPGGQVRVRRDGASATVERRGATPAAPTTTSTTARAATTTSIGSRTRSTGLLPLAPTTTTTAPASPPAERRERATSAPTSAGPLLLTPVSGGTVTVVERQRTYRGVIDLFLNDVGLKLVNQVDVEQYLRGMGEVRDPTWPAAALRTQAIAARTYALRAMGVGGEICDGQRCQVYLGQQAEYPAMDKAVAASAGQVLAFNAGLASAVYSSNGGGHSASREEGFGTTGGDYPYLRATPYMTENPLPWSTTIALADVAARLGGDAVTGVEVLAAGPSGRALTVALDGPSGRRTVSGLAFARALGLRSTMFSTRIAEADIAPDAPLAGAVIQAPPDEISAPADSGTVANHALTAVAMDLPDRPQSKTANAAAERTGSTTALLVVLGIGLWLALAAAGRRRRHNLL